MPAAPPCHFPDKLVFSGPYTQQHSPIEILPNDMDEIPVAQDIFKKLDLKHSIVTFNALHTQKETISIISGRKGDYVGGLKGNQSGLLEAVSSIFTDAKKEQIKKKGNDFYETFEKSHSQIETRHFYRIPASCGKEEWTKLKSFVCYEKYTYNVITGIEKTERKKDGFLPAVWYT